MPRINKDNLEVLAVAASLVIGAVVYALVAFSYAHATFLTVAEANIRKESRDKTESQMIDDLKEIKGDLKTLLRRSSER